MSPWWQNGVTAQYASREVILLQGFKQLLPIVKSARFWPFKKHRLHNCKYCVGA